MTDEIETQPADQPAAEAPTEDEPAARAPRAPKEPRAPKTPRLPAAPSEDPAAAPVPDEPPARVRPSLGSAPGPIVATDSLAEAGRKAMWTHVDRLLRHEVAMRDPDHADELRRYRVATRRLRAALRLFGPAFKGGDVEPLSEGLSSIADAVGVVRDLDVRIAGASEWATTRSPESLERIQPLLDDWRAARGAAMAILERRLDTKRHDRWLTRLVDFVEDIDPSGRQERPGRIVRDLAGSQVWRRFERVRSFAPAIRWADEATLHRLRIEAKRLRYSLEFLADVLGPDKPWLVERLVALQDHLGALNDATVTAGAVRTFLEQHQVRLSPDDRTEIVAYLNDREREARSLRRSVSRPWRAIAGITFSRRLARTAIVR